MFDLKHTLKCLLKEERRNLLDRLSENVNRARWHLKEIVMVMAELKEAEGSLNGDVPGPSLN